ncbi:hypothetical protein [Thalassospira tepidiphila]|uniref:hypothetical protein n=1 Tax=Thalassospira tepidiphila TaxID=393657 RepID=UPI0029226CE0|nr:hypothetical protein MACH01_13110 [Thalassospira tepidiphila]
MRFSDLNPVIILVLGACTGALGAALFFPVAVPLPDGWGDIIGSTLGVIGAFFVARAGFRMEEKSRRSNEVRPLISQLKVLSVGIQALLDALEKSTQVYAELAALHQSIMTPENQALFAEVRTKEATQVLLNEPTRRLALRADELLAPIRSKACNDVDHSALYRVSLLLPQAVEACRIIETQFVNYLTPSEILWLPRLIESLERAEEMDADCSEIVYEMADYSGFRPPEAIERIDFTLVTAPKVTSWQLEHHRTEVSDLIERLKS